MVEVGYRVNSDGVVTLVELAAADLAVVLGSLELSLRTYSQLGYALVLSWPEMAFDARGVHAVFARWADLAPTWRGLALLVPPQGLTAARALCADLAAQGAVVGAFSDLTGAKRFALREGAIWWEDEGQWLPALELRTVPGCSPSARKRSSDTHRLAIRPGVSPG